VTVSRMLAPFTPFLAEALHRNLSNGQSVHLVDYPAADPGARDAALETEMSQAREAVVQGLAARDRARLKVRQPLPAVTVTREFQPELANMIRDELNVKEVRTGEEFGLDTTITDELRLEGLARELVRLVQEQRKRSGLNIEDRIVLYHQARGDWARMLERFGGYVAAETLAVELRAERPEDLEGVTVGDELWIGLRRAN
jgi:isoleucyl-tRNA synthetase